MMGLVEALRQLHGVELAEVDWTYVFMELRNLVDDNTMALSVLEDMEISLLKSGKALEFEEKFLLAQEKIEDFTDELTELQETIDELSAENNLLREAVDDV